MNIQNAVNSLLGTAAAAGVATKHLKQQGDILDTAKADQKAAEAAEHSYGKDLNAILGEAMAKNPKLKEGKYMDKALSTMDAKKELMMRQREAWREYRNMAASPEEYAEREKVGQDRRKQNLSDFRSELDKIGKPGRPKGGK